MNRLRPQIAPFGFSLVELLAVVGIIGVLMAFSVMAFNHVVSGSSLTMASKTVQETLLAARQLAITKNRPVETRIYSFKDPAHGGKEGFYAMQYFLQLKPKEMAAGQTDTYKPWSKVDFLPSAVVLNADKKYSSLFGLALNAPLDNRTIPRVGTTYQYISIVFNPDGSVNLDQTLKWFVTVNNSNDLQTPPKNFVTLQLDPATGQVRTYRP